jgi:hypothetical protein
VARLPTDLLALLFAEHRPFLWGLCYRLTGCAADADDIQILNGLPALLIAFTDQSPRQAPRLVQQTTLTPEGDVKDIYAILAPRKLTAVHFVSGGSYDDTNTE